MFDLWQELRDNLNATAACPNDSNDFTLFELIRMVKWSEKSYRCVKFRIPFCTVQHVSSEIMKTGDIRKFPVI